MTVRERGAWVLVLLVVATWAVAFVLAAAGAAPSVGGGEPLAGARTGTATERQVDPQVVVVGVPGLTWDVVDDATTPTLARLARDGGTAALVLRGAHEVTCAADAWLTLGAGQRAGTNVEGCEGSRFEATPTSDRPAPVYVEDVVRGGAVEPGVWDRWRRAAAGRSLEAELGTLAALAEAGGTCVAAYGDLAVLGAAGPGGAAAVQVPASGLGIPVPAPGRAGTGSTTCRIHLVAASPVVPATGLPPADGSFQLRGPDPLPAGAIDAEIEQVVAELPEGTTLVVAGLGHTGGHAEATALIVHPVPTDGEGTGAALSSGSTQQRGLVQLTDLTPTALGLAGVELPGSGPTPLAGQPLTVLPGDGHVAQTKVLAAGISLAKSAAPWALGATAVVLVPLLVLTAVLRRGRALAVVATVAMAVPVACFLAGLVPWWRAGAPVTVLSLVVLGVAALVAALAWSGPWRREPLGPAAVVAAVTLAVLGVDMMWSARLGLVSVLGLQPVTAGRFYGQGNVGFGIALGAFLVLAGAVLTWSAGRREAAGEAPAATGSRRAAAAVALLGGAFTVVGAAPWGGADFGGVLSVVVATGLLVLAGLGLRWTPRVVLALGVLGVLVAAVVMVLDWLRGPDRRTHLGAFVQQVLDGQALGIVTRKLEQSLGILLSYPMSWLAVLALVVYAVVVVRRPTWSAPLWRQPGLRPTALAGLVAMALGWVLNDSGIAVVALALTMLIAAAVIVLGAHRGQGRPADVPPAPAQRQA